MCANCFARMSGCVDPKTGGSLDHLPCRSPRGPCTVEDAVRGGADRETAKRAEKRRLRRPTLH